MFDERAQRFGPWVKTGQDTLAEKLNELVGKHEFQLNEVRAKIAEYEGDIVKQAQQRVMLESLVGRVEQRLASAQATIFEHCGQLHGIRRKLVAGDVVLTSTGSVMNNSQVQSSIDHSQRAIAMAAGREQSLTQLRDLCRRTGEFAERVTCSSFSV